MWEISFLIILVLDRYLKKKVKDALSDSLKEEIEEERSHAMKKKQKFESALNRFLE